MNKFFLAKYFFYCFIFIQGCSSLKHSNKNSIEGVSYTTTFPDMFNKEARLTGYIQIQRNVYYCRDQTMYYGSNVTDSVVNGKVLSSRPVFYRFVYTKGCKYGHYYNEAFKYDGIRLLVDSFLNHETAYLPYKSNFYESTLNKGHRKFVSQQYNSDSSILNQIYTLKGGREPGKQAPEVYDSLYLKFSKNFRKTQYTLSKQFDSIMNMKLIQVTFILNPVDFEGGYVLEKLIAPHILEEINIDNADELMKYFDEDKRKNTEEEKRK